MRASSGLALAVLALWPRLSSAAPPAAPAAPPAEVPAERLELPAPDDAAQVGDPSPFAEDEDEEDDDPEELEPVEPPPPVATPDHPADPGDARADGEQTHDHMLSVTGKLGPKEIEANATAYGMIVANLVYDTGTVGPTGDSPVFAIAGSNIGDGLPTDGQFLITARQSRFGFKGSLQVTERVHINGLIELDFFGLHENEGPLAVINSAVRMRLARIEVGDERFRFIVGQDWSVVTPRLPTSLSHMVVSAHTFGGAVWSRLPQATFVFVQPLSRGRSPLGEQAFKLQVSAARNFSGDGFGGGITRLDKPDPGTLGKLPVAQVRAAFESEVFSFGLAGHLGRETYQVARLDDAGEFTTIDDHVPTWMASADLNVAGRWVWFSAQGYYGHNINGLGSNQGVRYDLWTAEEIDPADVRVGQYRDVVALPGAGGWAEFGALLGTEKLKLVASAGADVGEREQVEVGNRWLNTGVLTGLIYAPFPIFDMSLEYQRITSFYRGLPDAPTEQVRGQNNYIAASFRFKF
jgi:hypothetical protein